MKKFFQTTAAVFVGATASLLTINGLTAAHHNYWAYQWSKTCDFKPLAMHHAEQAASLNPIYSQDLFKISSSRSC